MEDFEISWKIPYPADFQHWRLFYPVRPWTTNKDRNLNPFTRAKHIKEWREAFKGLAEDACIPELEVLFIEATPQVPTRNFQDTSACNPATKAAIDGLIDAGVMEDDAKQWLKWILFRPCEYVKNEPGLWLDIFGRPL
jgi:hypothetical protein